MPAPMPAPSCERRWNAIRRRCCATPPVSSAGMATELALACFATLLWTITPEGPTKNVLFILATTTWVMTLAVMTRATLGHTGQALTAGPGTVGIYAALVGAVLARLGAGIWPDQAHLLHMAAGSGWIFAFGGFTLFYGPLLLRLPAAKRI